MILVDTNVVSEPLRPEPEPRVLRWFDNQSLRTLYISTIVVAELRFGVQKLPAGRNRDQLHEKIETHVLPKFIGRILTFDLAASEAYAKLRAKAQPGGYTSPVSDGFIAATVAVNGMVVATRDTAPFIAAGLKTINPWDT